MSGSGFFTITTTNAKGETVTRYTRDGSFQLTKDGYLVDSQGNRVQGSGGDIQIDPNAKDITIDNSGRITVDGEVKDTLKIVDFENYDYILKTGDNLYRVVDGATETTSNASVLQGYTEQSNVNVVSEMVDMITVTRAYEANQKMIRSQDSMLEKAVNQVGRLS